MKLEKSLPWYFAIARPRQGPPPKSFQIMTRLILFDSFLLLLRFCLNARGWVVPFPWNITLNYFHVVKTSSLPWQSRCSRQLRSSFDLLSMTSKAFHLKTTCVLHSFEELHFVQDAVILCHGLGSHKNGFHLKAIAQSLHEKGISSLRFDFPGCAESEGDFKYANIRHEVTHLLFHFLSKST